MIRKIKMHKDKKAISPLIATVLLISMTIVIAAIIFFWVRGFISEQIQKYGESADKVCERISFDASLSLGEGGIYYLDVINKGDVPINDLDIKKYIGGKAEVERISIGLDAGLSNRYSLSSLTSDVEKIQVIPVILGTASGSENRRPFMCAEEMAKELEVPQA